MEAVIIGNVTLDVICYPVEDVPRFDSVTFERSIVAPGGCGSNVAIGLAALGIDVALVANCGSDETSDILLSCWEKWGIDLQFVRQEPNKPTAVSVGLVDRQHQPRFIHAPGSNSTLTIESLDVNAYAAQGARVLGVAGFFVLLGFLDGRLGEVLQTARQRGLQTVLDVVHSPNMNNPEALWPVLPGLDVFLCNTQEAERITHEAEPEKAAEFLKNKGAKNVIVKLGAQGCWLDGVNNAIKIPGFSVDRVVDTTGAGDGFMAGLIGGLARGASLEEACRLGNQAGARMVAELGAISGWGTPPTQLMKSRYK